MLNQQRCGKQNIKQRSYLTMEIKLNNIKITIFLLQDVNQCNIKFKRTVLILRNVSNDIIYS